MYGDGFAVYHDTRLVGHVWYQGPPSEWAAESSLDGLSWDYIDTKAQAEELLCEHARASETLSRRKRLWCVTCDRDFSKYELAVTKWCFKCNKFIPFLKKR